MPTKVSNTDDLELKILELERRHAQQVGELKNSAAGIVDSMSPSNMIKNVLSDIKSAPGLKAAAIDTAIGIGTGFLGRRLFVGNSRNIVRKIAGSALQFLLTNVVRKRMPALREDKMKSNGVHHQEIK